MSAVGSRPRRRRFAPEVVQTSAMDCGPAALACLLAGHGLSVSYGRLREACQTDVDGTSINTLESIAVQCGLQAEQILVPVDHLFLPESMALPAIVVVQLPSGVTHFVVAWRRHGRLVQVMDPGTGRRWPTCQHFLDDLHVHTQVVPADDWRAWAETDDLLRCLRRRWTTLALRAAAVEALLTQVLADPDWVPLATLDATTRMVTAIVQSGGLRRGEQATRVFTTLFTRACQEDPAKPATVPAAYWMVRPAASPDGTPALSFRGAILVRIAGWQASSPAPVDTEVSASTDAPSPLSPDLAAALDAPPSRPGWHLLRLLRADGLLAPAMLGLGICLAASSVLVEAFLWRGLVDLTQHLGSFEYRLGALGALLLFVSALLLLDLVNALGLWRLGRHLEARLRLAFLAKIPQLGDRYFQSRPASDMAERSHSVHRLRLLPSLGGQMLAVTTELVATTAGLVWLAPSQALCTILAIVATQMLPFLLHPLLAEHDLRLRTHAGALGRFSLEALLGLTAIRTHGAEAAMHREYESLLVEWTRAGRRLHRTLVRVEGLQGLLGFGLAAGLLGAYLARGGEPGGVLLLTYWALRLPALGQELLVLARQYPGQRNITLRLLEPLGAQEEGDAEAQAASAGQPATLSSTASSQGMAITLEDVSVLAAGHTILTDLHVTIAPGSHVAIVGSSGAGKSSLVGLLLGWYRPATGRVVVEGRPLDDQHLAWVRQRTAWVDPAIQLWNRTLLENLCYGAADASASQLPLVLTQADLRGVLDRLPDGLQTALGEGGGLMSGGEGQRVRFGRALARRQVRLVILDEPFRGLDRAQRHTLLQRARQVWSHATLLCITHDVEVTQAFDRVLVVEEGQIVEDDAPASLASASATRYRALLDAEAAGHAGLWSSDIWRRLRLVDGHVCEEDSLQPTAAGHRQGEG